MEKSPQLIEAARRVIICAARYRTLAEHAPEAIGRLDQETRFTYIDEYGARLFGTHPPARWR